MRRPLHTVMILLLLLSVGGAASAQEEEVTPERVTLNFDDVEMPLFLKTMSEITGKSFVLNDKVKGKINFVSSEDVPIDKVYDVVLSILRAQGFLAVPQEENIIHIYPVQEALKLTGSIYYGTEPVQVGVEAIITQIVPLKNAAANDIVNVIRPMFPTTLLLTAYQRTNVIIANGPSPTIHLLLSMIKLLDTPIPTEVSDIHIYNLENSDAETMAQTLSNLASTVPVRKEKPQEEASAAFSERFKVVANKETNSLIIISAPDDYEKIKGIIRELDLKREQVLVEALIVEITLDDEESLGFDWNAIIDTGTGMSGVVSSNTGLMAQSIQTGGLSGLTVGLLNGTIPSVWAILNANREKTNFKILSTPEIVTIDNQEAIITIGEQIPFLTSSRVDENNNVISTYDYKDIGIVLKLTPHINKNGYITMEINQQVKKLVEGSTILENPSVYNREITSKITVKNERTIVIGGLIRDDTVNIEQKVPLLGDIPLLGLLFRKDTKQRIRTNLMIFITPHIVTDDETAQRVTEKKRSEQKEFEKAGE
jgi:general secretion pathway protein D